MPVRGSLVSVAGHSECRRSTGKEHPRSGRRDTSVGKPRTARLDQLRWAVEMLNRISVLTEAVDRSRRRRWETARDALRVVTVSHGGAMSSAQLYDTIGATYTATRRTEPRIAAQVWAALGSAGTVLNVGAGTGSYEPPDREVTAVEPSRVMRAQRPASAAACVAATAESLPFEDKRFDAAMAFATVHHLSLIHI